MDGRTAGRRPHDRRLGLAWGGPGPRIPSSVVRPNHHLRPDETSTVGPQLLRHQRVRRVPSPAQPRRRHRRRDPRARVGTPSSPAAWFPRAGEALIFPDGTPAPASGAMFVRWFSANQDNSSAATGSSVFDSQGDGAAEVLYQDACKLHVYDGRTGQSQFEEHNSSGTVHEHPLVVDVDGDSSAEFLAVANRSEDFLDVSCQQASPEFVPRHGVFAYGAEGQTWVPTRQILGTQHTHHITNISSDGASLWARMAAGPVYVEPFHSWPIYGQAGRAPSTVGLGAMVPERRQ